MLGFLLPIIHIVGNECKRHHVISQNTNDTCITDFEGRQIRIACNPHKHVQQKMTSFSFFEYCPYAYVSAAQCRQTLCIYEKTRMQLFFRTVVSRMLKTTMTNIVKLTHTKERATNICLSCNMQNNKVKLSVPVTPHLCTQLLKGSSPE